MLNIQRFVCNPLQENCYIVSDDTGESVIIDCGAFYEEERRAILDYIEKEHLKPTHLLATHAHIDHNIGNDTIYNRFGLKPEVAAADEPLMQRMDVQAQFILGIQLEQPLPPVGKYLSPQEEVTFGHHRLVVLPTPGHSPGSVLFYCEEEGLLFSGDTLFRMSVGRTDFELGSYRALCNSMKTVVAQLPPNTTVLCGHGPQTTIGDELRYNPYLQFE
ncbi:MAG: MBL fold metallo-hydrolase [Prevotella sp.]|nr:MBL fold metallo-hydrolase [Prevotella sp.]